MTNTQSPETAASLTIRPVPPDTEDKGYGFWKAGRWCQSAATKKANRSALRERRTRYLTGREEVCDE